MARVLRVVTHRVSSWNELNDRLFAGSWQGRLQRHRSRFAYRGMPRREEALTDTLSRLGTTVEGHLLRNFRKFAPSAGLRSDSVWDWLALAQHHGLPTRLLDWSFSPFVALHFATRDPSTFSEDGVVWCVDYVGAHRVLPARLRRPLTRETADVFTTEMLASAAPTLAAFDRLSSRPFVLFLDPPSLDQRIVNQFALFSVTSRPGAHMEGWVRAHARLAQCVVIPARLKWEVRDKLDQANITERVLFPGLDGLTQWLARYYTPRSALEEENGVPARPGRRRKPRLRTEP